MLWTKDRTLFGDHFTRLVIPEGRTAGYFFSSISSIQAEMYTIEQIFLS